MNKKKLIAILTLMCFIFTLVPMAAMAEDEIIYDCDRNGDGTNDCWNVSAEGEGNVVYAYLSTEDEGESFTLNFVGTGYMKDFESKGRGWYSQLKKITGVSISDGIKNVGNFALAHLENVSAFILPDSIEKIGEKGLAAAGTKDSFQVGANVNYIGDEAFIYTLFPTFSVNENNKQFKVNSDGILYSMDGKKLIAYPLGRTITTFDNSWLDDVEIIGSGAFRGLKATGTLLVPDTVKTVEKYAFSEGILSGNLYLSEGVTDIETYAFWGCGFTTIKIPRSVNRIEAAAFSMSGTLHSIDLTESQVKTYVNNGGFPDTAVIYARNEEAFSSLERGTKAITNDGMFLKGTLYEKGKLAEPIKSHYIFEGWYYDKDGTEIKVADNVLVDGIKEYYAKWKESAYSVTPDNLAFEPLICGETSQETKDLTVTSSDESTQSATDSESEYFNVVINDADATKITVTPKAGLAVGEYEEEIIIKTNDGATHNVTVTLTVVAPEPEPDTPAQTPNSSTGGYSGFTGVYNYPVSVDDVDGADVTLSEDNAVAGETVTITVTPDEGKQVRNVIVTDKEGNVIPVTKVGANEYTFTMPEGKVNITVTTKTADYDTTLVLKIDSPYVTINGNTVKNDVSPIINAEGRTMLPIRVIAEALGADVDWNPELQRVTITKDGTVIELFIGKYFAYVNGEIVKLDTAAFIENGRTYLQVRFISELLGCDVDWDAVTRMVTIQGNK